MERPPSVPRSHPIYKPLAKSESRLVHILPGSQDDPIKCTLSHFDIRAPPPYEALSYAWGDPKITFPISLSDHEFQVTTNLLLALQHLRYANKVRVFWIDAIAINQQDLDERAGQVMLMADIYGKAASVRIWLGPADMYSNLAIDHYNSNSYPDYRRRIHRLLPALRRLEETPDLVSLWRVAKDTRKARTIWLAYKAKHQTNNTTEQSRLRKDAEILLRTYGTIFLGQRAWFSRSVKRVDLRHRLLISVLIGAGVCKKLQQLRMRLCSAATGYYHGTV